MAMVFCRYAVLGFAFMIAVVFLSVGLSSSAEAASSAPIYIGSDDALDALGLPGEGTEENPYVLGGLDIDATGSSYAISLYGINKHLVVTECVIDNSGHVGIEIWYSSNISIQGNTVKNSADLAIFVNMCNNITVAGNDCWNSPLYGIYVQTSSDIEVVSNFITTSTEGISLRYAHHNTIFNNLVNNSNAGIVIYDSNWNDILSNTCDNNDGDGISASNSNHNTIAYNICSNNSVNGIGIYSSDASSFSNEIFNNLCIQNGDVLGAGIYMSSSDSYSSTGNSIFGNECDSNNYYGIWVLNSPNNAVTFNTVHENQGTGIYIDNSSSSHVVSNILTGNGDSGIWLDSSDGCTVEFNVASGNFDGIYLESSDSNILQSNDLNGNMDGIYLYDSSYNSISFNECNDSFTDGIYIEYANHNLIANNNCSGNNAGTGIYLYCSSMNTLQNNTCNDNAEGISLFSLTSVFSTENVLHNNTCNGNINNGVNVQARCDYTTITNNTCDDNGGRGVLLSASSYCWIANNTGLRNLDGLSISSINFENVMVSNDFSYNARYGMYISDSTGPLVANNTCVGNAQISIRVNNFYSGFIVNNTCNEAGVGIYLTSSNDNQVMNNNCSLNTADPSSNYGIWLTSSHRNAIQNNNCSQNGMHGIYLGYSNDNIIVNSHFVQNGQHGIYVYNSNDNTIANSTCLDNAGDGIRLTISDRNRVVNNTCASPNMNYVSNNAGIYLEGANQNLIANNTCHDNGDGLHIYSGEFNTVDGNNLSYNNNYFGTKVNIKIQASNNNVSNNTCLGSSVGLSISAGDDLRIEGNTFNNNAVGISLYNLWHERIVIANNTCNGNGYGIYLHYVSNSWIFNNTCEDNGKAGMFFEKRAINNVISNNTIRNNGYQLIDDGYGMAFAGHGLAMDGAGEYDNCYDNAISNNTIEGNRLYGIIMNSATGNRLYGNVLIGNNGAMSAYDPAHVQAYDNGANLWNVTEYGNLWADWTSPDANGDGIVDQAYLIDGGTNKDLLPLAVSVAITSPINGFATGETSVDISGTAISYFGVDHLTWYNAATGESGDCAGTDTWTATVPLVDGDNVITVTMFDLQGAEANASLTVVLDVVPPILVINSPTDGAYLGSNVTVSWTGTDVDSGIAYYLVSIESVFSDNVTGSSCTINGLAEGSYTVLVSAYDLVGNYLDTSVSFTVDITDPMVTILSPADDSLITSSSVTVTWNGSDAISGLDHYEVSWEGGTPVTLLSSAGSYTFTGLSDGYHVLTVVVYDRAGLSSTDSVTVLIDTQGPSLTITSPFQDGFVNSSDVTVTWSGSDVGTGIAYYTASIEGLESFNTTGTSCLFNDLADGTYTVLVSAYDQLGNYRDVIVTFTVDTAKPTLVITGPTEGQLFNSSSVTIVWTTSDANPGTVQVRFDGEGWTTTIGEEFVKTALTDGHHIAYVKATDAAGNSVERAVNFTVDTLAPTVAFVSPEEGSLLNDSTGIVEWITDAVASSIRVDGGDWIEIGANSSWEYSLEDGVHAIEVKVSDSAGNFAIASLNFTVDTTAPTAEHSPTGDDLALDLLILVEFSEPMNQTSISIAVSGVTGTLAWEGNAITFTPSQLTYNTVYEITVSGKDLAGNAMHLNWTIRTTAGSGGVSGVLVDQDGDPIANVTVRVGDRTAITDEQGRFILNDLAPGNYVLTVDEDGYEMYSDTVAIVAGESDELGELTLVKEGAEGENDNGGVLIYALVAIAALLAVGVALVFLRKKK